MSATIASAPATASPSAASTKLQLKLRAITCLADDICSFEFVDPQLRPLPPFTAGAHIDVHLPDGTIRQYSLCNDATETHRYVVAVLRDPNGRGGSVAMHDALRAGMTVTVSTPRNHFELADEATRFLFIGGGIGITPLMSMISEVRARGQQFQLVYCTRTPEKTAFLRELQPLISSGHVTVHHDHGDPSKGVDLTKLLHEVPPGTHLYYCGPNGLMDAIDRASAHWPKGTTHCERFSAPAGEPIDTSADREFEVELVRSRKTFTVPVGQSIVHVMQAHGMDIDVSCEEGYCGTCMTRYLEGEPIHRDSVLDEEDREEFVMICCSRAKSKKLVLDL
jgi:ferredoxin-NADP reductase